jgi:uncharacterized protein (TIGR02145 family)
MKKDILTIAIIALTFFLFSCEKEPEADKPRIHYYPEIKIDSIKNKLLYSVEAYATFINDGGDKIKKNGFCWSKITNPTINDSSLFLNDTINFSAIIKKLQQNTEYFLKAFAFNSKDTAYSNEISFYTWDGKLTDIDANTYKGIQIGNQGWMAENLKVKHYSDGTPIRTTCPYNNYFWYGEGHNYLADSEADLDLDGDLDSIDGKLYTDTYGLLYTWYAAINLYSHSCNGWINKKVAENAIDVCPVGWHVPTESEWQELIDTVNNNAQLLKSKNLWYTNGGTDSYGFNALPGGGRDNSGDFWNLTATTGYHSSTVYNDYNSYGISILATSNTIDLGIGGKEGSAAVRCIKNK